MSRKSNQVTKHLTADERRRHGGLRGGAVQRRRAAIGLREKTGAQDARADAASAVPASRAFSSTRALAYVPIASGRPTWSPAMF
jgi:hypothetical protein